MTQPLLVFAMEQESQDVFSDYDVLHTGIGKVNASYNFMRHLRNNKPDLVVNMGTAGSRKHDGGAIINCTSFIQRDMDVTPLGIEKWQTPFSVDPIRIEHGLRLNTLPEGICGTGDNFDTSVEAAHFDVVDMEAYALALICQRENIPFLCLKYISDGANDDANIDWVESLHKTAESLRQHIEPIKWSALL